MTARDITPEERLLNLIKKKKRDDQPKSSRPPADVVKEPASAPVHGRTAAQEMPAPFFSFEGAGSLKRLKMLNLFLSVVFLLSIIIFVSRLFIAPPLPDRDGVDADRARPEEKPGDIETMPVDYFSKSISRPGVFIPRSAEEAPEVQPGPPSDGPAPAFALVGIISGAEPQAIIEDTAQNKRMFITEGQSSGGIMLKKIGDGSVTIIYRDRELNLSL